MGHPRFLCLQRDFFISNDEVGQECPTHMRFLGIKKRPEGRFSIHRFYFQNIKVKRKLCQGLEVYIWHVLLGIDGFE